MAGDLIITASTIITMEPGGATRHGRSGGYRGGDHHRGGPLTQCRAAAPGAAERDLGDTVLMPGFIEAHNHPFLSGVVTRPPAYWIAPYVGYPTWDDVVTAFRKVQAEQPAGAPVGRTGLDRLLQQVAEPTDTTLDTFFPDRPVAVLDNSGHEVYFNSATISLLGWTAGPPPDPERARFGRNAVGTSNGRAYETAGVLAVAGPLMAVAIGHPLSDANEALTCPLPDTMIRKQGIKLWADGSPRVGTAALSYPYLDSATVRNAGIPIGPAGESAMNYSRAQLDASLDRFAGKGWQMSFHVNGDVGLDVVLDAYERALSVQGLSGTDHRWRVEHLGGARADQFPRVTSLGVHASLGPFRFIYCGDLLDGELFPSEIGSEWMRFGDAVDAGVCVSFHNDGSVSPPTPLLNVQTAITRTTPSGTLHGKDQVISLDAALAAQTIDASRTLHREHEIGSIAEGKLADFVELSTDPYRAEPSGFCDQVTVGGTWRGGRRIDLDALLAEVKAIDPAAHAHLAKPAGQCP